MSQRQSQLLLYIALKENLKYNHPLAREFMVSLLQQL